MQTGRERIVRILCVLALMAGGIFVAGAGQASRAGKTGAENPAASRRYINLPGRAVQAPFSDAVLVGNTLYLAGRIGIDPATGKPPAAIEDELKILFDGFHATLKEAGMTMDDMVYVQIFCPDLSLYDKFNAAYRAQFGKEVPARAFIGAGSLLRGGHFEMQAIAVRR